MCTMKVAYLTYNSVLVGWIVYRDKESKRQMRLASISHFAPRSLMYCIMAWSTSWIGGIMSMTRASVFEKEREVDVLKQPRYIYIPMLRKLQRPPTSATDSMSTEQPPFTDHSVTLTQMAHLMWTSDLCLHVSAKFPPFLWPQCALWCSLLHRCRLHNRHSWSITSHKCVLTEGPQEVRDSLDWA